MVLSLRRLECGELVDVGAGNERFFTRTGDDHHANRRIVLELENRAAQLVGRRGIEGVEDGRTVDREDRDGTVAVEKQVVKSHAVSRGQDAAGSTLLLPATCHLAHQYTPRPTPKEADR